MKLKATIALTLLLASSDVMSATTCGTPINTTFIGGSNKLTSNPDNWINKVVPLTGDNILILSNTAEWDLPVCPDGNSDPYDGCDECTPTQLVCGNGVVEHWFGEECDYANYEGNGTFNGCDSNCQRKYDCTSDKPCYVIFDSAIGQCNLGDSRAIPVPRTSHNLSDLYAANFFWAGQYPPQYKRIILCEGIWKIPADPYGISLEGSDLVGYDPPTIPNISFNYDGLVTATLHKGYLYPLYHQAPRGSNNITTWVPEPHATILESVNSMGNVLLIRYGGTGNWNHYSLIAGLVIRGARGQGCAYVNGSYYDCQDAAGIRDYCHNGLTVENVVFTDNVIGFKGKDTAPQWPFDSAISHNFFYRNIKDGINIQYGNSWYISDNTFIGNGNAQLNMIDTTDNIVIHNTFGYQYKYTMMFQSIMYPPGTLINNLVTENNFIGSNYEPSWNSFIDACPSCGHFQNNFYKWHFDTRKTEGSLDSNPVDWEYNMPSYWYPYQDGC